VAERISSLLSLFEAASFGAVQKIVVPSGAAGDCV
jgi:hypothetical protein